MRPDYGFYRVVVFDEINFFPLFVHFSKIDIKTKMGPYYGKTMLEFKLENKSYSGNSIQN